MKHISIIVAVAENNAIGKGNKLLWHISEDLKRFKRLTTGCHVVMGKKTYESLPVKPLPNRTNVVISDIEGELIKGCEMAYSIEEAIEKCPDNEESFIIGGGSVYRQFLPLADKLYITKVHKAFDADTFFPEIDEDEWQLNEREDVEPDGNNDFSFIKPDLSIVVADPLRAGDELDYYPSDINIKNADVVIINKCNSSQSYERDALVNNIKKLNENCELIFTDSIVTVDSPEFLGLKDVVVVEDGPTLTHGGMEYGAGIVAANKYNCNVCFPINYAVGSIDETFKKYPHVTDVLPAMGYSPEQLQDLEDTINAVPCDTVVVATPIDLGALININKPYTRVYYDIEDGIIDEVIEEFIRTESR